MKVSRIGGEISLPETEHGWRARKQWLADWYAGFDYSPEDVQLLKLFHAVDEDLNIIATTKRLMRDAQFVVDTDARALASGKWSLEPAAASGLQSVPEEATAIWTRSRLQQRKHAILHKAAMLGDVYVEAVKEPDGKVRLYSYDPRWCKVTYADDGITILKLEVEQATFLDPEHSLLKTTKRIITPEYIQVSDLGDAGYKTREEGEHNLGVAPVVHLRFQELDHLPEHGLWAGFGLDTPLQAIDSIMSQIRAIGNRYAHPHTVITGAEFEDGNLEEFGKIWQGIPKEGKVEYLEPSMAGVQTLLEVARFQHNELKATIPEFVFGAGANTSGHAYELRLDAFQRKMLEIQQRLSLEFSTITAIGVQFEREEPFDVDTEMLRIKHPPVLPTNKSRVIEDMLRLRDKNLILDEDVISALQAVNVLDEEIEPTEYVARLRSQRELYNSSSE